MRVFGWFQVKADSSEQPPVADHALSSTIMIRVSLASVSYSPLEVENRDVELKIA
jgi:hypothetical protein